MYTVSKDGALYGWTYKRTAAGATAGAAAAAAAAADNDAEEQQPEASTSAPSTMDYSGGWLTHLLRPLLLCCASEAWLPCHLIKWQC
jgi:hypothetical protein